MNNRLISILFVLIVIAIVSLSLSSATLATVTSDSMEPELEIGDVYLVYPDSSVESGDVVMFYSEKKSGYVTHRIVGETQQGYITQGDANLITDQQAGHPYITEAGIVGSALSVRGTPIALPNSSWVFQGISAYRMQLLGGLVFLYIVSLLLDGSKPRVRQFSRVKPPRIKYDDIIIGTVAVAFVLTTVFILLTSSATPYSVVVADQPSNPTDGVLQRYETQNMTVNVTRPAGLQSITHSVPSVYGARVTRIDSPKSNPKLSLVAGPYDTSGSKQVRVSTVTYPAVLPYEMVAFLHGVSPIMASGVTSLLLWAPLGLLMVVLVPKSTRVRIVTVPGLKRMMR